MKANGLIIHYPKHLDTLPDAGYATSMCGEWRSVGVLSNDSAEVNCPGCLYQGPEGVTVRLTVVELVDDDNECEGHESLAGGHMGESVYCDGTCVR